FASATKTVEPELSQPTVRHFISCVVCFYLGRFVLGRAGRLIGFWLCVFCGFALVLAVGWEQHFGGLAATREFYFKNVYPTLKESPPPEFMKKMSSTRIFSTLFYPNALAGTILLFLPPLLAAIGSARGWLTFSARIF